MLLITYLITWENAIIYMGTDSDFALRFLVLFKQSDQVVV